MRSHDVERSQVNDELWQVCLGQSDRRIQHKAMVKEKLKVIIEYKLEKDFNTWTQCVFLLTFSTTFSN
jgi:hypothetical protein